MTFPRNFGRYTLLNEIARGAYGIVYRALDRETKGVVALKTLRSDSPSETTVSRFIREARLGGRLHHPNLVRIFGLGYESGRPFLTMEWVEGETLSERLRKGPLPTGEAAEIARSLARTLAYAHANGVIHRDLKPSNIILSSRGPVLTDFGIARDPQTPDRLTATGELIGTPVYMAPEQIEGRVKEADRRCDVYGLGVVLYEMLTGHPPFSGATFSELSLKILHDDPEPPPAFAEVCARCLRKDPRDRFPSAEAVAEALEIPERNHWLARALLATLLLAAVIGGLMIALA